MSLIHSLLAAFYPVLRLHNNLLRQFGVKSDARLRVLIYHDIAPQDQETFATQLRWMAQSWTFVSPQLFTAMIRGDYPINGANLLLTFDDGFTSNRKVVEEVLNPIGIKALFFVVSAFVDIAGGDNYQAFVARHIWPGLLPDAVPDHWRNMTWDDLSWLLECGHTIGAHTRTHARLSELAEATKLEEEIIACANVLEQKLGVAIEHFAYPFGNLASISPAAQAIARRRFKYIYTGLRGDNARPAPPWALRRDHIEPTHVSGLIGAFLEGGADMHYTRKISQYESWG